MNSDQHRRRKIVIDANLDAVHASWSKETKWINIGLDALKDWSDATKRSEVLDESGTAAA